MLHSFPVLTISIPILHRSDKFLKEISQNKSGSVLPHKNLRRQTVIQITNLANHQTNHQIDTSEYILI